MTLTHYFKEGFSYADYLRKIEDQLHDLEKSDKESEMIPHYALNLKRIERLGKTFQLSDEQKEALKSIKPNFKLLVISEGWCGDAAQVMPIVHVIAEELGIEQKVVLRDSHPELMDAYLTNGAKSIPIFVGVNEDGTEKFRFGPRPEMGMKLLAKHKENPDVYTKDEFHKELQLWYNKDKGNSIFNELFELMKL